MVNGPEADQPCDFDPACLGFPLIFLTLLTHGFALYAVKQTLWLPSPAIEQVWGAAVGLGVTSGLMLSILGGRFKS